MGIGAAAADSAEVVSVEDAVTIVEEVDLEGAIADPADMAAEEEMIEDMIVAKAEVIAIVQENAIVDTVVGMTNFVKLVCCVRSTHSLSKTPNFLTLEYQ